MADDIAGQSFEDALAELGARPWQRELVGPVLLAAIRPS